MHIPQLEHTELYCTADHKVCAFAVPLEFCKVINTSTLSSNINSTWM